MRHSLPRFWKLPPLFPELAKELGQSLSLRPLTAQLMLNRGIRTKEEAQRFLRPRLGDLRPPEGETAMAGFTKAVERIRQAILSKECIGIFGDYDVDGITTCALLTNFLSKTETRVIPRIARRNEGYGFGLTDGEYFVQEGCSLIITGDCGTSDYATLSRCKEAGVDVIVVDHHQVPDRPIEAFSLLNPHQPGCLFPFKGLASVGIAFYLLAVLKTRLLQAKWPYIPQLQPLLDLVALGTIGDLAPLVQENRILVSVGLKELLRTQRPGLQDLASLAGLPVGASSVADVAFRLAPRLNAPGRLGNSEDALKVFLEEDPTKARQYAKACHDLNVERQQIQKRVLEEAEEEAEKLIRTASSEVLVVAKEGWHSGVVGIVAAKLVEVYERPVVVMAIEDGVARGSARTAHGFHLYQGLKQASNLLVRYGGHAAAAGLLLEENNIPSLRTALCTAYKEQLGQEGTPSILSIEAQVQLDDIDEDLIREISFLGPFGMANPEPLFLLESAEILQARVVGKNHLQVRLRSSDKEAQAIGFGFAKNQPLFQAGSKVQAAFIPEMDTYRPNARQVRLRLKELAPMNELAPLDKSSPLEEEPHPKG